LWLDIHTYIQLLRGLNLKYNPKNFREILEQLWWKLDHFLDYDSIKASALTFGIDQMKAGSTTLIDHHASGTIEGSLDIIRQALNDVIGIRAILAFETSDRFNVDACIKENSNFIQKNESNHIAGLFGLHASFTLSVATLNKVKDHLQGAGIHIHVAESQMDEDDSYSKYGKSVVKRLDDFGLINNKSILVHCTNVSEEELDIIAKRQAIIAINTTSNLNNAVGLPDVAKMRAKGIKVIIGNDGLIPSMPIEYLNAYYTAHLKTNNPVGYPIEGIKEAIINSYDYVNMMLKTKLGRISVGYDADLITFPYHDFTNLDQENIFGHLFFGVFPNLKPQHVFCAGKMLVKDYDIEEHLKNIYETSKLSASNLWDRIKKEGDKLEFKD